MTWNPARLPRQDGRVFVVTGGNAGVGYFTAEQLARAGARVVLASRSLERADAAITAIRGQVPGADLASVHLDLASLESARRAGDHLRGLDRIDGLSLNAGMTTGSRRRQVTRDHHELIFGTNYLGHFALAATAWPAIARTMGSRVVGLGSLATRLVPLDPTDLPSERRFGFFRAYGFSKHAMQGFILELDRRLRASGSTTSALLAHPGLALDRLSARRPGLAPGSVAELAVGFAAQGKNHGAASVVRALLDPDARGGECYGPRGMVKGPPERFEPVASSAAPQFGRRLWRLSEEWTGETFRP